MRMTNANQVCKTTSEKFLNSPVAIKFAGIIEQDLIYKGA